jgi:hypothetical protein
MGCVLTVAIDVHLLSNFDVVVNLYVVFAFPTRKAKQN